MSCPLYQSLGLPVNLFEHPKWIMQSSNVFKCSHSPNKELDGHSVSFVCFLQLFETNIISIPSKHSNTCAVADFLRIESPPYAGKQSRSDLVKTKCDNNLYWEFRQVKFSKNNKNIPARHPTMYEIYTLLNAITLAIVGEFVDKGGDF